MKKGILVFVMMMMAGAGFGQITFEKYMTDGTIGVTFWAGTAQQTNDGGYIIGGGYGVAFEDYCLMKTNQLGVIQWSNITAEPNIQVMSVVKQTTDGGYITAGSEFQHPPFGYLLKKYNAAGGLSWSKKFKGIRSAYSYNDVCTTLEQTADGGYILAGSINDSTDNDNGLLIIKTDNVGNIIWLQNIKYVGIAYSVKQTMDGGYILCASGCTGCNGSCLIKFDSVGIILWEKTYSSFSAVYGASNPILQTNDGGCIMAGIHVGDYCLIKTNNAGDTVWTKTYGGTGVDNCYSVRKTNDGGFILAGSSSSFGASNNPYLVKIDSLGNLLWSNIYSGVAFCYTAFQTGDGGYFVLGDQNMVQIKTDSLGNSCNSYVPVTIVGHLNTTTSIPTLSEFQGVITTSPSFPTYSQGISNTVCISVGVSDMVTNNEQLNLFPNPASNNLTIAFGKTTKKVVVTITDITGKLIYTTTASETEKMEVSTKDFAEGVYIVKVQTGDGVEMKKLIVEK